MLLAIAFFIGNERSSGKPAPYRYTLIVCNANRTQCNFIQLLLWKIYNSKYLLSTDEAQYDLDLVKLKFIFDNSCIQSLHEYTYTYITHRTKVARLVEERVARTVNRVYFLICGLLALESGRSKFVTIM